MKRIARKLSEAKIREFITFGGITLGLAEECNANVEDASHWTYPDTTVYHSCLEFHSAVTDPRIGELRHFMFDTSCSEVEVGVTPVLCIRLTRKGYLRASVHPVEKCPHCTYWDSAREAAEGHKPLPKMLMPYTRL